MVIILILFTSFTFFFFFNDTATTEIYTLSLHDALPIWTPRPSVTWRKPALPPYSPVRSEEHTSELQSRENIVCRLLLEKKKNNNIRLSLSKKKMIMIKKLIFLNLI